MKTFWEKLKTVHWAYLLFAITLVVLGFCFIIFENALPYLAVFIGILVCVAAVFQAVSAMAATNRQLKFYIRMSVAVLSLAAGVVTIVARESAIYVLTSLFGLLLIIDGSFKLQTTVQSKRYRVAGWWVLLGIAVATILGGFLLTKFPPENLSVLAVLLGLVLIVDGAGNFFSLFYITTYEHRMADLYLRRAKKAVVAEQAVPTEEPANDSEAPSPAEEPASEIQASAPAEEPTSEIQASAPAEEPTSEIQASAPAEEPASEIQAPTPAEEAPASNDETPDTDAVLKEKTEA